MKSFLLKILLFTLLVYAFGWAMYGVLYTFERNYFNTKFKCRWISDIKNKNTDYIFLGSSRMANMVAVNQLDSLLNTTSINIATEASSYGENYALFHRYLKNGNKAKTLVLTFDLFKGIHQNWNNEAMNPLIFKHFEFFPYYDDPEIRGVFADHSKPWKLYAWDYMPISRYVEFNNYLKVDQMNDYFFFNKKDTAIFDKINGERLIHSSTFDGKKRAAPENIQLGPRGERYLYKILDLAKKHNMKIILITAPYYDIDKTELPAYIKLIQTLKEKYNVQYFNFSILPEWKEKKYFTDAIHTNAPGSRIFTKYLADSLKGVN